MARQAARGHVSMKPMLRCLAFLLLLFPAMTVGAANGERQTSARNYLASIQPSPELQVFLDQTVKQLLARDTQARKAKLGIALIDLNPGRPPRLAHWNGETPIYPASVVKFVYLMAAYAWQEEGKLQIDNVLDRQLTQMIYRSSNKATQQVVARLTETQPGPVLPDHHYLQFRKRRLAVKRWLESLGVVGIHSIHPTYDGGGDLFGREIQLLQDDSIAGGLESRDGTFHNRQAMSAVATAKLLTLLATDRALTPEHSAEVRLRMLRDPARQPYLIHRIAGGAIGTKGVEVYSKTGTWGPIFADAGIVHYRSARQIVLAVFIESRPAYRGNFIAALTQRTIERLLASPTPQLTDDRTVK
jgi:beta-lactamase class A